MSAQIQPRLADSALAPRERPLPWRALCVCALLIACWLGPVHRDAIAQESNGEFSGEGTPLVGEVLASGARRLRAFPRSSVRVNAQWFPVPGTDEWVAAVTSGVNLIIDGADPQDTLDISTDRLVIWTTGFSEPDLSGATVQEEERQLELYLEGNIIFRQGDRIIYADSMYYDVRARTGTILNAELLTPAEGYLGLLRLRSDVLQQVGKDRYLSERTYITSSRIGAPRYRLQSNGIYFEDLQTPAIDPVTGAQAVEPDTGEPIIDHRRLATSNNNLVYVGGVPVFYWPVVATDLERPTYYIRSAQIQNDRIFGTWISADFDSYQVLGIQDPPDGTDWKFGLDYLTERGFGFGTTFTYTRPDILGFGGPAYGVADFWGISDFGKDNLGDGRSALEPEANFRNRLYARHRQTVFGDYQLSGELGWISDRNFLEQYYESEWDQRKDQTTGVELKRYVDNSSYSVQIDGRVNDFFTQTEWLPRGDHFWLGQSLLGDQLTWFEHSQLAFARLRTTSFPENPEESAIFAPLPWEATSTGERFVTRQELDYPMQLGPVKFVPYVLGEAAHWGEDLSGDSLDRLYGQVGLRASIPFWAVNPYVESALFNVHGIAHKIVLDAEFLYSDANRDIGKLPLYDPLDDDSVEHFRRRFQTLTFGGATPLRFDERFYALRDGLGSWVTSPSTEIADDQMQVRLGARQRWQTKRGPPGQRRIIDWIVLDTEAVLYPNPDRDNFGEVLGLLDYDFRWHVGDRLTLLSTGAYDFFSEGQKQFTIGAFLTRPPRSNWYFGFRSLDGPIHSRLITTSYSYRLSPKWVLVAGTSLDLGERRNVGQQFGITRVGESFLTSVQLNVDSGKDNVGVMFLIEPRFIPGTRLGRIAGAQIPPSGINGLE